MGPTVSMTRAALGPVHARRFGTHDFERFILVWCEVARIMHVSPLDMHANQTLDALYARSKDPADTRDDLADFVCFLVDEEVTGEMLLAPLQDGVTAGSLVDWLLHHWTT